MIQNEVLSNAVEVVAETDRLLLRKVLHSDFDFFFRIFNDPEVMKYYSNYRNAEQTRSWIEFNHDHYITYGHGKWSIIRKSDGQLLGHTGLVMTDIDGTQEVELGYFLDSQYWGQGYATEAARAGLKLGFEKFGYKRLISAINPLNLPSIEVAKRLQMQKERNSTARVGETVWNCDVYVRHQP